MSISRPYTGKDRGSKRTVKYRDAAGKTFTAIVLAANGASNLDLRLPIRRQTLTNIPPATSPTSTNAWFSPKTA